MMPTYTQELLPRHARKNTPMARAHLRSDWHASALQLDLRCAPAFGVPYLACNDMQSSILLGKSERCCQADVAKSRQIFESK